MPDQYYQTATPSQYFSITGVYLRETACGHKHRSVRTAEQCSHKRNPTRAPGTLVVDVVNEDFELVRQDVVW